MKKKTDFWRIWWSLCTEELNSILEELEKEFYSAMKDENLKELDYYLKNMQAEKIHCILQKDYRRNRRG